MIKVARKPSSDPIQEKLRQNKSLWNKDVSQFINDLIHFKKTMNGVPSKFYQQKGNIKEPIPADPATIIGVLAGDFQDIAQKGNGLIEEQMAYSKSRRKSQPKIPQTAELSAAPEAVSPAPTNEPAPDLSKQLAAFETKYELVAEGSNAITRFFTRLLTPTFGISEAARIRKYRMNLLDVALKTYKDFNKFEVAIVKSGNASIKPANELFLKTWNDWILVARGYNTYKANMPKQVQDDGGEIPPSKEIAAIRSQKDQAAENPPEFNEEEGSDQRLPDQDFKPRNNSPENDLATPEEEVAQQSDLPTPPSVKMDDDKVVQFYLDTAKKTIQDYRTNFRKLDPAITNGYEKHFEAAATKYMTAPGHFKPNAAKSLIQAYQFLIEQIQSGTGKNVSSIADAVKQTAVPNKPTPKVVPIISAPPLETVAQDFLKKWFGKTSHQLSIFDKTSSYRLDIFKMSKEAQNSIDQMMDLLEKGMDIDKLNPLIVEVNKKMVHLRGLMRALNMSVPKKVK